MKKRQPWMEKGRNTEREGQSSLAEFHPWLYARVWTTPWATATNWPRAKKARTSSVFRIGTPLRAISGNWPSVAKLSGKTAVFGLLAHLVVRGVRLRARWGARGGEH